MRNSATEIIEMIFLKPLLALVLLDLSWTD